MAAMLAVARFALCGALVGRLWAECPVVSEIAADPADGEPEWIELASRSGSGQVLSGWTVGGGRTVGRLDSSAFLPPGGLLVVSPDCERLRAWHGSSSIPCAEPTSWNALSVGSDLVLLRDGEGNLCDSVAWDAGWPDWPDGRSLERSTLGSAGSVASAWIAGPQGGTPGWMTESVLGPVGTAIRLEMESRRVDPGERRILARLAAPWDLRMKAEVYDLSRRRVAVVHDGPVPSDGKLVWDGTERGKAVLPGAHLLVVEVGTGSRNVQARFREWIVVAR